MNFHSIPFSDQAIGIAFSVPIDQYNGASYVSPTSSETEKMNMLLKQIQGLAAEMSSIKSSLIDRSPKSPPVVQDTLPRLTSLADELQDSPAPNAADVLVDIKSKISIPDEPVSPQEPASPSLLSALISLSPVNQWFSPSEPEALPDQIKPEATDEPNTSSKRAQLKAKTVREVSFYRIGLVTFAVKKIQRAFRKFAIHRDRKSLAALIGA